MCVDTEIFRSPPSEVGGDACVYDIVAFPIVGGKDTNVCAWMWEAFVALPTEVGREAYCVWI